MSGEREQSLKDVPEKTVADLKDLSLIVDTMRMELEREGMEPQITASLKDIGMGLSYIQRNISDTLKTEQETG